MNRLGFNLVRTVSTAFALRQLSRDSSLGAIRPDLEQVWKTSNMIASICFAAAKQAFGRQPDAAMVAGLLHSIGRLYILMHAHHADPAMRIDPAFAAKLHHRLDAEPELRTELPEADGLLNSVNLGKGSFMDLVAASQTDIAEIHQALAA